MLASGQPLHVEVIDRLPTPCGLVRYGVAPDHATMKTVTRVLTGWLRLEEYEGALGAANGRGRVKVHDLESMLRHCAVSV